MHKTATANHMPFDHDVLGKKSDNIRRVFGAEFDKTLSPSPARLKGDANIDEQLLASMLAASDSHENVKFLAKRMIAEYGSFGRVISASPHDLRVCLESVFQRAILRNSSMLAAA